MKNGRRQLGKTRLTMAVSMQIPPFRRKRKASIPAFAKESCTVPPSRMEWTDDRRIPRIFRKARCPEKGPVAPAVNRFTRRGAFFLPAPLPRALYSA